MEQTQPLTQQLLRALVREELQEQKKRKPQCSPGAPAHDQHGRFSGPEMDRGSWSLKKHEPYDPDCRSGVARRPSANDLQQTTQMPCGRDEDGGKAKWKCKDGTPSHTPSPITEGELIHLLEAGVNCGECWKKFLTGLNQAARAQKGKLLQKSQ